MNNQTTSITTYKKSSEVPAHHWAIYRYTQHVQTQLEELKATLPLSIASLNPLEHREHLATNGNITKLMRYTPLLDCLKNSEAFKEARAIIEPLLKKEADEEDRKEAVRGRIRAKKDELLSKHEELKAMAEKTIETSPPMRALRKECEALRTELQEIGAEIETPTVTTD